MKPKWTSEGALSFFEDVFSSVVQTHSTSEDKTAYLKSSKEIRWSYSISQIANEGLIRVCIGKISKNAGLIRIRVLFEGGSLSRIYGI